MQFPLRFTLTEAMFDLIFPKTKYVYDFSNYYETGKYNTPRLIQQLVRNETTGLFPIHRMGDIVSDIRVISTTKVDRVLINLNGWTTLITHIPDNHIIKIPLHRGIPIVASLFTDFSVQVIGGSPNTIVTACYLLLDTKDRQECAQKSHHIVYGDKTLVVENNIAGIQDHSFSKDSPLPQVN